MLGFAGARARPNQRALHLAGMAHLQLRPAPLSHVPMAVCGPASVPCRFGLAERRESEATSGCETRDFFCPPRRLRSRYIEHMDDNPMHGEDRSATAGQAVSGIGA